MYVSNACSCTVSRQPVVPPETKVAVTLFLAVRSVRDRLPHGSVAVAAPGFGLDRHTIRKIWRQHHNVSALVQGRQQRPPPPRRLTDEEVVERVGDTPLCQRQNLRSLSAATGIPKITLLHYLKRSVIQWQILRVRPTLTPAYRTLWLAWALARVDRPIGTQFCVEFGTIDN
ncbi:hypothetical protein JG687_00019138 [Phytophthora cactorum]|uniref:Uncharacterized protein n=1 Tax=Phytophthora cactorum TaxID=29920 RepID=A0A8T1TJG3_9STRA|nr:hypothetical protein JG687_00019138 [Phytophthora cactorum]